MEEEFLTAVNKHQGIILKVCRMYCADSIDAEDLFQEIVLQLWKAFPGFKGDAKISTWIYKIGFNTAITRLRKTSRSPKLEELSIAQYTIAEQGTQRLDILFDRELQDAIALLNKFDKALVMLYLDEKSYREIADIMGLSESNVGVKISRIKMKLKQKMNP